MDLLAYKLADLITNWLTDLLITVLLTCWLTDWLTDQIADLQSSIVDDQLTDWHTLITFCFTRVSCDIQIHQLINGIKYTSALADCVPSSRSATVINIRILLKATSYFSPPLHYVQIFTSHIFLKKKNWVDYCVYHCLNLNKV